VIGDNCPGLGRAMPEEQPVWILTLTATPTRYSLTEHLACDADQRKTRITLERARKHIQRARAWPRRRELPGISGEPVGRCPGVVGRMTGCAGAAEASCCSKRSAVAGAGRLRDFPAKSVKARHAAVCGAGKCISLVSAVVNADDL
jgi:hypothetical protein